MSNRIAKEYKAAAAELYRKLPLEYILHVVQNEDYVMPVEKQVEKSAAGWGLRESRVNEIENLAIHCRNVYHTRMIRIELTKLIKESI